MTNGMITIMRVRKPTNVRATPWETLRAYDLLDTYEHGPEPEVIINPAPAAIEVTVQTGGRGLLGGLFGR